MITQKMDVIQNSMLDSLRKVEKHNWDRSFAQAKSRVIFRTSFYSNGFDYQVTIVGKEL